MKTTQLKNLIRATVREAINEMLAEKFLEKAIDEMFTRRQGRSLHEDVCVNDNEEEAEQTPKPKKSKKAEQEERAVLQESIRQNLGFGDNNMLNDLFADTYYNNPAMDESKAPVAGEISESDMEKIGIMGKDWSKFL